MPKTEKIHYDFSGWASKNNVRCSDGTTIREGAFSECDGLTVPLFWNHDHKSIKSVVGKCLLHSRPEGTYIYGTFNDTDEGQAAKARVGHGDITGLSACFGVKKRRGGDILHGSIREVSLVMAPADPEALIDSVISHSDSGEEVCTMTVFDEDGYLVLNHSDDYVEVEYEDDEEENDENVEHADTDIENMSIPDALNTLDPKMKELVYGLIASALQSGNQNNDESESGDVNHSTTEGENNMSYNAFESKNGQTEEVISHAESFATFKGILQFASENNRSMRDSVQLALNDDEICHGIHDVEMLFPEFTELNKPPKFIKDRPDGWVNKVFGGVKHQPFERIRTTFADITEDEARAKGYITGDQKTEEFFSLVRRETEGQMIYKYQEFDRDTVLQITDFDTVAWVKGEMQYKWKEEVARALLIGDGRSNASRDKIKTDKVRPIYGDDGLFVIYKTFSVPANATSDQIAHAYIRACQFALDDYEGSGTPTLYCPKGVMTKCTTMEDGIGRAIYETRAKVTDAIGVKEAVEVPPMKGMKRVVDGKTHVLMGIMVDLADYTVGTNKGGQMSFFDDFDIKFNKNQYLYEGRCSGALTEVKSAIVLECVYGLTCIVTPVAGTATVLGKTVSDIQTGIMVHNNWIQGTLKYVTNWTGYSQDPAENFGNFLCLQFAPTDGATVQVSLNGKAFKTLDSDLQYVVRITKDMKKPFITVKTTLNGEEIVEDYKLGSLTLLDE